MRRIAPLITIAALVVSCLATLAARATPDFSGTWVYDAEHSSKTQMQLVGTYSSSGTATQSFREVPLTPVWGDRFTAKQDATSFTIERTITPMSMARTMNGVTEPQTKGDPVTFAVTYLLDGSERKNSIPSTSLGRPASEMTVTAAWEGDKLVTTTWSAAAPKPFKTIRAVHLNADGILLVDLTVPPIDGVSASPSTSTTAYKRAR